MKAIKYSDRELVGLIQNGGNDLEIAFKYLLNVERRMLSIRKLILGLGGKQMDYEEILDDTLVALHSSVKSNRFKKESSVNAYMYGIARKLWYKKWSRQKSNPRPLDQPLEDSEPSVEVILITEERRKILLRFINRLGESCRKILIKAFIEGNKNQELVIMLGYKNEAVVRKKKSQCLKRLVTIFRENPENLKQLET